MKNIYKWLVGAVVVTTAICAYKPFDNTINIENVDSGQAYEIGNNSYVMLPVNAIGKITGDIDGDAIVVVSDKDIPLDTIVAQLSKLKKTNIIRTGIVFI